MYNAVYLAAHFNVSLSTIRTALRKSGRGVGMAGTYQFTDEELPAVLRDLGKILGRPAVEVPTTTPSPLDAVPLESRSAYEPVPSGRGARVGQVLVDNKRTVIMLVLAVLGALLGVDLAL